LLLKCVNYYHLKIYRLSWKYLSFNL